VRGVIAANRNKPKAKAHIATWGKDCKPQSGYHCYDYSYWAMKGAEEVVGAFSEDTTAYMEVPGWQEEDFVDNEEWASNPAVPNTWTEMGQQGGRDWNCCGVHWFWAFRNGINGFISYHAPPYVWEVSLREPHWYTMDTGGGGRWCWYYGKSEEALAGCETDFAWQATILETGAEVATESKPSFDASVNNSAEWTNYTWHTWNFSNMNITTPGLCWSGLNGAPGNIIYGTCNENQET
jgi:hypothetical protein